MKKFVYMKIRFTFVLRRERNQQEKPKRRYGNNDYSLSLSVGYQLFFSYVVVTSREKTKL